MKILIVDDEPLFLSVLKTTLSNMGHNIFDASNGREAFEIWKRYDIPLVITDWRMPEMDGIKLCAAIRREKRDFYTYIIILTALGTKEAYVNGLAAGADDFIVKPFDDIMLEAKLKVAERIIGLNRRINQLETLLPVCSWCKKIRTKDSQWITLENYVKTQTTISHTICPECAKRYFNSNDGKV